MWTLVYSGTEQALGDWGICGDFECEFASKARDSVMMRTIEGFDAGAAQFAWGQPMKVWRDRTAAVGGGFENGTLFFQGTVGEIRRRTDGGRQWIEYVIYGPWWLLERLKFKQARMVFDHWVAANDPTSGAVLKTLLLSEIYLGEKLDETWQTNGAQVVEILNWANECYNPTKRGASSGRDDSQDILQLGAIDPAVNFPKTRVNDIFCAEGLVSVLRWSPDVVCWFDYTTSPPTFNARAMGNLGLVTVDITSDQERQIELAPQYARQLAGVWIHYKKTDTINGVAWPAVYVDAYPPGITDYTPDVAVHTVELAGSQVTRVSVPVVVVPVAAAVTGDAATRKAWWLLVDKTLSDANIDPASIVCDAAAVQDEQGNTVDLGAYPNTLIKGQLSDWMGVRWVDVTVMATISYNRYADAARKIPSASVEKKETHHRVTLTNAVSQTYRAVTHYDPGESVPVGVAQAVYNSVATLQHAGTIKFVAGQLKSGLSVGQRMSLAGPSSTYANLLVQSVRAEPHRGTLEVSYGPSSVLDAPARIELARATRWRMIYNMPSGRSSGRAPGSADVGLGTATAKENTQHGLGSYSFQAAVYDQGSTGGNPNGMTQIGKDAKNEVLTLCRLDANGNVMTQDGGGNALGRVAVALADTGGKEVTLQEMTVCDASSGAQKKVRVLASAPY